MSKGDYSSKNISVLDEIEHIRLHPGMYIGETTNPTRLIEEVVDNALDECLAGFASIIAVNINTKDCVYAVIDNGRGIPITNNTPNIISTKMFSGAKFQHTKTAYDIVSGLHGIGLVAVNALSSFYVVEIYRDKRHGVFNFENSKFKSKKIDKFEEVRPFSTKIIFKPDKQIFESLLPDIERVRKRLLIASVELPQVTLVLNIDESREIIKIDKHHYFDKYCLTNSDNNCSKVMSFISSDEVESFGVTFCYTLEGSITPRVLSSINLLPVDNGGTHVNCFFEILRDIFVAKGKRLGFHFQPQDSLCGLRSYLSLYLRKPEFHGQTKDKLVNRKSYFDKLLKKVKLSIESYFDKEQDELKVILNLFEQYRRKVDSRKLRSTANEKRASTKFTKLRDCNSRNGELFITEGQSASGSLIQCRDPRIHAILPLKGKVPNISNAKDILKNKEIGELIQSLGTGVGPNFDISKLRYDKIICATDADPDGSHIASLVTMVLAVLVPEIIKKQKYYIAQTPLFAINEGKTFIPLWTEQEVNKARNENRKITRYKGLGEMNPSQLKVCLIDKPTRKLIQLSYTDSLKKLIKLFSESSEKRDLLERSGEWSHFEEVIRE